MQNAEKLAKSFKVEYTKLGRFGPTIAPFEVRLGLVRLGLVRLG